MKFQYHAECWGNVHIVKFRSRRTANTVWRPYGARKNGYYGDDWAFHSTLRAYISFDDGRLEYLMEGRWPDWRDDSKPLLPIVIFTPSHFSSAPTHSPAAQTLYVAREIRRQIHSTACHSPICAMLPDTRGFFYTGHYSRHELRFNIALHEWYRD